jgi:hypothetical protein
MSGCAGPSEPITSHVVRCSDRVPRQTTSCATLFFCNVNITPNDPKKQYHELNLNFLSLLNEKCFGYFPASHNITSIECERQEVRLAPKPPLSTALTHRDLFLFTIMKHVSSCTTVLKCLSRLTFYVSFDHFVLLNKI